MAVVGISHWTRAEEVPYPRHLEGPRGIRLDLIIILMVSPFADARRYM